MAAINGTAPLPASSVVPAPISASEAPIPVSSSPAAVPSSPGTPDAASSAPAAPAVISVTSEPPSITVVATASASPAVTSISAPFSSETPSSSASLSVVNVFTTLAPSTASASSQAPQTVVITSVQSAESSQPADPSTSSTPTSSSQSGSAALATSGASTSSSSGISAGGKIAVAVVVPVVAVALIVATGLLFWRRRKQRKSAESLRRKEAEDYGYNPNNDPLMPAVAGANMPPGDPEFSEKGYRGWGTTSTARKPSTTLSSSHRGAIGIARSASGSDTGQYTNTGSPTQATNQSIADQSDDPLLHGGTGGTTPNHSRPLSGASETIGALGAGPNASKSYTGVHRGPSNASSAYSGAQRSDISAEGGSSPPGGHLYSDNAYFDEPQHGPYSDGSYGGGQPVIRDVPARRNTRIESPSVIPAPGSAGIAQNF